MYRVLYMIRGGACYLSFFSDTGVPRTQAECIEHAAGLNKNYIGDIYSRYFVVSEDEYQTFWRSKVDLNGWLGKVDIVAPETAP